MAQSTQCVPPINLALVEQVRGNKYPVFPSSSGYVDAGSCTIRSTIGAAYARQGTATLSLAFSRGGARVPGATAGAGMRDGEVFMLLISGNDTKPMLIREQLDQGRKNRLCNPSTRCGRIRLAPFSKLVIRLALAP